MSIAWPGAGLAVVEALDWPARRAEEPMTTARKSTDRKNAAPTSGFEAKGTRRGSGKERKPAIGHAVRKSKSKSKSEKVIALLKGPSGASLAELVDACGWQQHSVRGFLSGTVKKRKGLLLTSGVDADGVRRYRVGT
jgi:hypothetical protein